MENVNTLIRELIAANSHTVGQYGLLVANEELRAKLDIRVTPLGDFFDSTPITFYTNCPPQNVYYMDMGKLARDTRTLQLKTWEVK